SDQTTNLLHWGNFSLDTLGDRDPYLTDLRQTNLFYGFISGKTAITNPIISGGYWTNTNNFPGTLTIDYTPSAATASIGFTNISTGDWFIATNGTGTGRTVFQLGPNDYLIATQKNATVTVDQSFFRP